MALVWSTRTPWSMAHQLRNFPSTRSRRLSELTNKKRRRAGIPRIPGPPVANSLNKSGWTKESVMPADTILYNAKIATNGVPSFAEAIAITDGKIIAIGSDREIFRLRGPNTRIIDASGRTVIPGLNDSHMHPIRAGLSYNMELRWDGVPSIADALSMLREQAARTPAPQWVRVIGGGTEFPVAERRMPTPGENKAAAPDTPAFLLPFFDSALLNWAGLRAVGYTKD